MVMTAIATIMLVICSCVLHYSKNGDKFRCKHFTKKLFSSKVMFVWIW